MYLDKKFIGTTQETHWQRRQRRLHYKSYLKIFQFCEINYVNFGVKIHVDIQLINVDLNRGGGAVG